MENRYSRVVLLEDGETVHNAFFDRKFCAMKIRCFADTDTMLIEFRDAPVAETRDLDENTILDLDDRGNIRSITIEHAPHFSYGQVAA